MTQIRVPRYRAPSHVTTGADGIPDYVTSWVGSPYRFLPPPGFLFYVHHNGVRLRHVIEADRKAGWAIGQHDQPVDAAGVSRHRFYEGVITFHLERRGNG